MSEPDKLKNMDRNKIDEFFQHRDKRRASAPVKTIVKRQNELVQKHPKLKPMLMEDPLARAWVETWSRTDMSIEDGLVELAVHLQEAKQDTFKRLEDYITRNPGLI